jgi:hypothetical protein
VRGAAPRNAGTPISARSTTRRPRTSAPTATRCSSSRGSWAPSSRAPDTTDPGLGLVHLRRRRPRHPRGRPPRRPAHGTGHAALRDPRRCRAHHRPRHASRSMWACCGASSSGPTSTSSRPSPRAITATRRWARPARSTTRACTTPASSSPTTGAATSPSRPRRCTTSSSPPSRRSPTPTRDQGRHRRPLDGRARAALLPALRPDAPARRRVAARARLGRRGLRRERHPRRHALRGLRPRARAARRGRQLRLAHHPDLPRRRAGHDARDLPAPAPHQARPGHRRRDRRPVDLFDPETWNAVRLGPRRPRPDRRAPQAHARTRADEARRAIALDHLAKCLAKAEQAHRALDVPATPPPA